jgi:hypothetical protein
MIGAHSKKFLAAEVWLKPLAAALIGIGTVSRLAPLTEPHGRLLKQFMSEDGYLMQTIAHNLGIGLGLTVADGTIQTNGFQPLGVFICSLIYFLVGGDKISGIAGVALFSILVSLVSSRLIYVLLVRVLKGHPEGQVLSLLVATLWFASAVTVKHSMNGLETGLYLLVSIATVSVFTHFAEENNSRFSLKQMLILGAMLGICFLVRNDAVFLIAAVLLARILLVWPSSATEWRDRIVEAIVSGLISVLIATPWLVYNYRLFGSIMPISGIAESLGARFGQNLIYMPAVLLEYVLVVVPIPNVLHTKLPIVFLSILLVVAAIVFAARIIWTQSKSARYLLITYAIYGTLLFSFYGLYFGVPEFLSRYLSVLSPVLALLGVVAAYRCCLLLNERIRRPILALGAALITILVIGLNSRLYRNGLHHEHFQVVDWVTAHVPQDTWVGAIQTGTLGFFHDRTINLDGKVNPDALRARIKEGGVSSYVLRSSIMFLADWYGIAGWSRIEKENFNRKFQVIVADKQANLAVLQRVNADVR